MKNKAKELAWKFIDEALEKYYENQEEEWIKENHQGLITKKIFLGELNRIIGHINDLEKTDKKDDLLKASGGAG